MARILAYLLKSGSVEKIVLGSSGFIRKSRKNLAQFRELFTALNAGQQFLPDETDDFCATFLNQRGEFGYNRPFRNA
jgi:hypothetical protein